MHQQSRLLMFGRQVPHSVPLLVTISLHYYCYSLMGLLLLFKRLKLCGCEKEERRDGGEKVVSDEMCQVWFDNRSRRLLLI